jgi:hypothetical protein
LISSPFWSSNPTSNPFAASTVFKWPEPLIKCPSFAETTTDNTVRKTFTPIWFIFFFSVKIPFNNFYIFDSSVFDAAAWCHQRSADYDFRHFNNPAFLEDKDRNASVRFRLFGYVTVAPFEVICFYFQVF